MQNMYIYIYTIYIYIHINTYTSIYQKMMPDSSKMIFEETDPDITICKSVLASLSKKHRRLPDEGYDLWNYVLDAMQSFVQSH